MAAARVRGGAVWARDWGDGGDAKLRQGGRRDFEPRWVGLVGHSRRGRGKNATGRWTGGGRREIQQVEYNL
jgi:hypothetical protein